MALERTGADPGRIVAAFHKYMEHGGHRVTRALFERNLASKLTDRQFNADITPLLAAGYEWDSRSAATVIGSQLIARLPGEPWKDADKKG
jgi:hypothetical protein